MTFSLCHFLRDRRGSVGIEAAMALPAMLVMFGAVSQVLITAQARVHLEQAAYAAARSALVHKCPDFNLVAKLKSGVGALRPTQCSGGGIPIPIPGIPTPSQTDQSQQRAEDAARWALIAAAPTTGSASGRGCPNAPAAAHELMTGRDQIDGRDQAVKNAICYVFEPGNVTVDLEWDTSLLSQLSGKTDVPIKATVTFKFPLSTPFRRFIKDGERSDGTYYKISSATVTLL